MPADGRNRGLIARVHIRTFVAVDLDGDKVLVDDLGQLRIFIALPIHHVAPVAPHRFEIEDDEAFLGRGAGEQLVVPAARSRPAFGKRGRRRKRGNGKCGNAEEFHGGSRS